MDWCDNCHLPEPAANMNQPMPMSKSMLRWKPDAWPLNVPGSATGNAGAVQRAGNVC
jgi:hypothetical protein